MPTEPAAGSVIFDGIATVAEETLPYSQQLSKTQDSVTLYVAPGESPVQVAVVPAPTGILTVPFRAPFRTVQFTITLSYVATGAVQDTVILLDVVLTTSGDTGGIASENAVKSKLFIHVLPIDQF
jgi:hypothetical protein